MSTTSLTAGEVMDRSAALMNDPAKTDYTYVAQLPYLNMAIDELVELLEESNISPTNQTSVSIILAIGLNKITPTESVTTPHYPTDLIEIQEVGERDSGSTLNYTKMERKEFLTITPATGFLGYWIWEDQQIKFNPNGATTVRDIQLKYVRQAISLATNDTTVIGTINARSYLAFKTAALCSQFIGENETRAQMLEVKAEEAIERMTGISNKGRQEVVTRHRPFRSGYKMRGY